MQKTTNKMQEKIDRDTLVRVETKLDRAIEDINKLADNQQRQLETLNLSKMDSKDFAEWGKQIIEQGKDIQRLREFKDKVTGAYAVLYCLGSLLAAVLVNLILKHFNI